MAGELLNLLAAEFPDRAVQGVGDATYHGKPLLMKGTTWTTRLPANAALYDLAPPPTGRRGRAALKGASLGRPADLAATAAWRQVGVLRYGCTDTIQIAIVDCIWYGSFGNAEGQCVLVRDEDSTKACDLALFTLDHEAGTAQVVERYAVRWSIEPSNAAGKQQMGERHHRPPTGRAPV